jgi:hypothetical protein
MNEITRDVNLTINQTPPRLDNQQQPAVEEAKTPTDQVTLSQPKESTARKVIHFPAKVLGKAVGAVTGAISSPLHVLPGAAKGAQEGVASYKGRGSEGFFHFTHWAQNLAIGAGAGLMIGGPFGAAIGAGAAALVTGVSTFVGEESKAYDKMIEHVEAKVDKAVEDNTGPKMKVLVQSATEGAIIGGSTAGKVGFQVGYEAGKGIVEGTFGAVEGLAEGVWEAGKSLVKGTKPEESKPPVNQELPQAPQEETPAVETPAGEKKDIGKIRKFTEKVIGSPVGLVTMAGKAVGGLFGGGVAGVTEHKRDARGPLAITSGMAYVGMGAGAGLMLGGIPGSIVGGVAGLGLALLSGASGSMEKVADKVGQKAKEATADNVPSESKVKDTVMDFTEGAIVGAAHGGVEGLKQGTSYGAGIVSGVIEGTKGAVGSLAGTYEKKEAAEQKPDDTSFGKKVLNAVLRFPRNVTRLIAGTATGSATAAMGVIDGLAQGTYLGATEGNKGSAGFHRVVQGLQIAAGGALAGAAFAGGGWMIAAGAGAGIIAAGIIESITHHTETDKEFAQGLGQAVKHAKSDNVYEKPLDEYGDRDKTVYESFRDGIEGAMTGTGAGVREGFKEGFQAGSGIVDGVFDAAKGLAKGVAGGITGAGKKPAPEVAEEGTAQQAPVQEGENAPTQVAAEPAKEKTFGQKAIEFPGKVVKGIVGAAVGIASAPLHILPGAAKGLYEGINTRFRGKMLPFHGTMFAQNITAGAVAGFVMGGPVAAAIGAGGGLVFSGLTTWMGEKTGVYDELAKKTDDRIKEALKDNTGTGTEVAFQNATEGAVIGAVTAATKGFSVGYDSGSGAVSGAVDVVEGAIEGLYESGKNVVNRLKGEKPEKTEK